MDPLKLKPEDEEGKIQKRIMNKLRMRGWYCISTHGNELQFGFPDIFACHLNYGSRWIEVKKPKGYAFTRQQLIDFPKFRDHGIGIWVLTGDDDSEINKLFKPMNWWHYLDIMKPVTRARGSSKKDYERVKKVASRGPERDIQDSVIEALEKNNWFVKETHGNMYQQGLPDLYACHAKYLGRWIEIKNPEGYTFTPAQHRVFPQMSANGAGIWILTDPSQLDLLFTPPNWTHFLSIYK